MNTEAQPTPDNEVVIMEPDYALKKKIGENVDLKEIFSDENVSKSQKVLDNKQGDFVGWATQDLQVMEQAYSSGHEAFMATQTSIAQIQKLAGTMKGRAGSFGYGLATQVAKSLHDFCEKNYQCEEKHWIVIQKHIETLRAIFQLDIKGDGGAIGKELQQSLNALIAKYVS